jgi:hypothetical protein
MGARIVKPWLASWIIQQGLAIGGIAAILFGYSTAGLIMLVAALVLDGVRLMILGAPRHDAAD